MITAGTNLIAMGERAREVSRELARIPARSRINALHAIAHSLHINSHSVLDANATDMEAAEAKGLRSNLQDRLLLTPERLEGLAQSVVDIAEMPDPVGEVVESTLREDGLRIEELLSNGPVGATVTVKTEERVSRNVVAEKPGLGEDVVVLGAHFDTVPNISGANDNASGTAVLLTVAGELSRETLPFTLRFIAFGSEELGLEGSLHYVALLNDTQRKRIKAMFNFDAVGSGEQLGILGSSELTNLASEQGDGQGIDVRISPGPSGGGSDHFSFSRAGIPAIMFFSEDFSRLHTPADTLDFVTPSHLGDAAGLALTVLRSQEFLAVLN